MNLLWTADAWDEYIWFQEDEPKLVKKLNRLFRECQRTPSEGTGKPEPLRREFTGHWSRRITDEHRLIYRVEAGQIVIVGCRFHYDK
ncbi:Putative mRNA interferase YoeB [Deinococcus saxicola]|uniref:Txe/YoeB family addiction module toxin n=1 Tax=Deinococcus saxicola TaxID=249406 RepID=UPI0039F01D5A